MTTLNKELIKQIIIDFEFFYLSGKPWLCSFEDVVNEFAETRSSNDYVIDKEE